MVLQLEKSNRKQELKLKEYVLGKSEMQHMKRVGIISKILAKELKLEKKEVDLIYQSGKLHDIGKKFINPSILNKPGYLTKEEYEIIKEHAFYSAYDALNKNYEIEIVNNLLFHHENYDGTGYYAMQGEEIPIGARIIRIADVFDALTMDRPYRPKLSYSKALDIMEKEKKNFDPNIFTVFKNIIQKQGGNII